MKMIKLRACFMHNKINGLGEYVILVTLTLW